MKELTGKIDPSTYQYSQRNKEIVDRNIKEFLDNNKEMAVNQLAERLSRTKAAKEALNKTIESIF